jgi:hypothetical protein
MRWLGPIGAFLGTLLAEDNSIVPQDEEMRMLEESRRQQAAREAAAQ